MITWMTNMPSRLRTLAAVAGFTLMSGAAFAAGGPKIPFKQPEGGWSFDGPLGTYDRSALQRGYQVYKQICAACHAMELIRFRNLGEPGGPEFPVEQVEAMAAEALIPVPFDEDGNTTDENGLPITRAGLPADAFPKPFANENAARAANGGAYPPDLSVINKARHGGADYIYSLLMGYADPPEGTEMQPGMYYNKYMSGNQIAMAPPLIEGILEYQDGTEATEAQMAADVSHFLQWAGDPKMEIRKDLGLKVMIYLGIFAILMYLVYRRVWRDVEH